LSVRELRVASVRGDEAEVDLDATLAYPDGTVRLSGPATLRRVDDEWRVADYVVDGRRLSSVQWQPPGSVQEDRLGLAVPYLALHERSTSIYLEFTSDRDRKVVPIDVWRGARVLGLRHYLRVPLSGDVVIEPHATTLVLAGWRERFSPTTRELRILVRAGEVDGPARFVFHLAVRRDGIDRLTGLPLAVRLSPRMRRTLAYTPLAVTIVGLLLHRWTIAGLALALEAVGAIAYIGVMLRRRVASPRRAWRLALLAGAVAAFGFALAFAPGFLGTGAACTHLRKTSDDFVYDVAFFGAHPADEFVVQSSPLRNGSIVRSLERLHRRMNVVSFAAAPRGTRARCTVTIHRGDACYRYAFARATVETSVTCTSAGPRIRDARARD
jgi:hypothetical protein